MNSKARILTLFIVFSLITGFFTGCYDDNGEKAVKIASEISIEATEVIWYITGDQPTDKDTVLEEANKYLKDKINTSLQMNFIPANDYTQKINAVINSGVKFDICFTSSAHNFKQNVYKGAFIPLNILLDKYGEDVKKTVDSCLWENVIFDGNIYAIPTNQELPYAPIWAFNKELALKYSLQIEGYTTLKSLGAALKIIKENETEITPFAMNHDGLHSAFDEFDMILGDDIPVGVLYTDTADTTVVNPYETNIVINKLKILQNYYEKGYINQNATTLETLPVSRFLTAEYGQPYADTTWSSNYGYEVISVPKSNFYITTTSSTNAMNSISVTSKNPEKAMELLNLVNTDSKLRNLLQFGIEDTHYKKSGDTSVVLLAKADDYKITSYALGNLFITYTVDTEPVDKWDKVEEFNNSAKLSPILGFTFNPENVSSQIAAVSKVTYEYKSQVLTGSADFDTVYPEMMEEYKQAGIEDIMTEAQQQIDKWKEAKS